MEPEHLHWTIFFTGCAIGAILQYWLPRLLLHLDETQAPRRLLFALLSALEKSPFRKDR
jgi:hypothetical protein